MLLPSCQLHRAIPSQTGGGEVSGAGTPHWHGASPLHHPPGLHIPRPRGRPHHGRETPSLFGTAPARSPEDHRSLQLRISSCAEKLVLWPKTTPFYDRSPKSPAMARAAAGMAPGEHLANELSGHQTGAATQDRKGTQMGKCCCRMNTENRWEHWKSSGTQRGQEGPRPGRLRSPRHG